MRDRVETEAPAPIRCLVVGGPSDRAVSLVETEPRLSLMRIALSRQALQEALAGAEYDIAIVDSRLRWADEQEILDNLKTAFPNRPVVLFTDVVERLAERARGFDDYITPETEKRLLVVAAACLARYAQRDVRRALDESERSESAIRDSKKRASFLVCLADATRPLEKPEDIATVTMQLLREALAADGCAYAEVNPDEGDFAFTAMAAAPGVPAPFGRFSMSSFGGDVAALLRAGRPFVVEDTEARLPEAADRQVYQEVSIGALIAVPIVKSGRLVAAAGVHMLSRREWTEGEVELVDLVAERLWESMERARISRALRESETEFRALFELSAVGVAQTDLQSGRFTRVNHRFCEITGYSENELLEKTFGDITHPDDRERNAAAIAAVIRGEAPRWSIEKRYIRRDGRSVWVHVSGGVIADARGAPHRLVANVVDVTDRKAAEEALLASRRQLQVVTDSAPVLLASCDADYRFTFVNKAYADRVGKERRDIVGRTFSEVLGVEAFAQLKPHADRALRGERSEFEAEVYYRDFGKQWIRCAYAPEWDDSGRIVGWVAAIINITDRKRAEEALLEADRRKDEFLAVLGHELRNPLAPLQSGVELLQAVARKPELVESVRAMMERQLGHLVHLVDDLLDLSRISRGQIALRHALLDLRAVVEAAVELSRPVVDQRRHTLLVSHADTQLPITGDFERLTQVIGNLLSNAAKYTAPGGTISVCAAVENGAASVSVSDTGYGIPKEKLEQVFDMFSQVPEHRTHTGGGGLGIGLALSKQLVDLHGGSIVARSGGLGHGSEFVVRLPLEDRAPESEAAPQRVGSVSQRRRVLVVDDNADAAETLRMMLELKGHDVIAVYDGEQALRAVETFTPEIVLLDIGLPEMDGHEVARRIRARPGGDRVMLYAITGWGQDQDKKQAQEAGFDGHLTKPVNAARLLALLTDLR